MSDNKPLISIPLMVHNRRAQTMATIATLRRSALWPRVELLICDHGSRDTERIDVELLAKCGALRYCEYVPPDEMNRSPILKWNQLFGRCRGEYVLLTTPECLHVGDVLSVLTSCKLRSHGFWRAAACWGADKARSEQIRAIAWSTGERDDWAQYVDHAVGSKGAREYTYDRTENVWLNHGTFRRCFYLSALIHRTDLESLGGFDEAFAGDVGHEDTDLFRRATALGLDPVWLTHEQPYMVHQWHEPTYSVAEVANSPNRQRVEA